MTVSMVNNLRGDSMENIYTIREVAKTLKVNPNFVYNEIKNGNIKAIKIGSLKILESEVARYINSKTA